MTNNIVADSVMPDSWLVPAAGIASKKVDLSQADSKQTVHPRQLLSKSALGVLNQRSNLAGTVRFGLHLSVVCLGGWLWAYASGLWQVLGLVAYGVGLAFMFCALHECVHRTAFASVRVNDAIAWIAGLLSFYNSTFYRRYHQWHHRYTRIEGKDPELTDLTPKTLFEYVWVLSGIPWWKGKIVGHIKMALGAFEGCAYIPECAYADVVWSTRLQLAAYGAIALCSTLLGHPLFLITYWVLPLAVGQPFLRFVLLAEHTGCTYDDNALANTRTTLTLWPLRFLMWNMSYHAEHHLYPSIPFHALAKAHVVLKEKFETVDAGYVRVNKEIVRGVN